MSRNDLSHHRFELHQSHVLQFAHSSASVYHKRLSTPNLHVKCNLTSGKYAQDSTEQKQPEDRDSYRGGENEKKYVTAMTSAGSAVIEA